MIANLEQGWFFVFFVLNNYKLFLKHRTSSCKQQIVRILHFSLNLLKCLLIKKTFYNRLQELIKYQLKYDTWCYTQQKGKLFFLCTQHGIQHHLRRISMSLLQKAACDLL